MSTRGKGPATAPRPSWEGLPTCELCGHRQPGVEASPEVCPCRFEAVTAHVLAALHGSVDSPDRASPARPRRRPTRFGHPTALLALGLVIAIGASLAVGAKPIPLSEVLHALVAFDPGSTDQLIVRRLRLPRTIVGAGAGASFAVAGAIMQGLTRNPLAAPGLLGVNAGASFAVVLAIWAFGLASVGGLVWFAFVGAAVASVLVFTLGSVGRGGAQTVRLALAGAALTAFLGSFTAAVLVLDQATLDQFRFWVVGSLAGRGATTAAQVAPFVLVGMVVAVGVSRQLDILALGDDEARALGIRVGLAKGLSVMAITLLCGAAVAAVGPIGFVGLVVPHTMRAIVGPDHRRLIPACALAGPTMLLGSDTLGRVIARPGELPVGITTAAIGGTIFVLVARAMKVAEL
ncbi:MAG: FecCD family ABC transporter permease [Acidimicrobiales bacterium]